MTTEEQARKAAPPTEDLFRAVYPGGEVREASEGPPILHGHFAVFNEWTEINSDYEGQFMERIAPGAFAESFASGPPQILFQHGRDPKIGDKVLGSPVTVREDDTGAYYEVPLFPSVDPLLLDGLRARVYGASFRFHVTAQDIVREPKRSDYNPYALPERTINGARVPEAGPVTFAQYAGATAGIRSLTDEFRPHDLDDELARMVRDHPRDLALRIERALKSNPGTERAPEATPTKPPRFRTREEYLQWLSRN